jgi:hypothetical protein
LLDYYILKCTLRATFDLNLYLGDVGKMRASTFARQDIKDVSVDQAPRDGEGSKNAPFGDATAFEYGHRILHLENNGDLGSSTRAPPASLSVVEFSTPQRHLL